MSGLWTAALVMAGTWLALGLYLASLQGRLAKAQAELTVEREAAPPTVAVLDATERVGVEDER